MQLKDFIKNSIKDITEAVSEIDSESQRNMYVSGQDSKSIEFDIAVSIEDSVNKSGRAGIKVYQITEGGGEVSKEIKNSSVSRLKFSIYVERFTKKEHEEFKVERDKNYQILDNQYI